MNRIELFSRWLKGKSLYLLVYLFKNRLLKVIQFFLKSNRQKQTILITFYAWQDLNFLNFSFKIKFNFITNFIYSYLSQPKLDGFSRCEIDEKTIHSLNRCHFIVIVIVSANSYVNVILNLTDWLIEMIYLI